MPRQPAAPKLTDDIRENLLRFLRGGLPMDVAATMAGTNEGAVSVWRQKSVKGTRGYKGFDEQVRMAIAEGESLMVARIQAAGKTNWRADAWLLERLHPERWGPPAPSQFPDAPPVPETNAEFPNL